MPMITAIGNLDTSGEAELSAREAIEVSGLTLERRETTIHDQLEITKLTLGQDQSREGLSLLLKLASFGSIASDEILQDAAVGWVGHDDTVYRMPNICADRLSNGLKYGQMSV